MQIASGTYVKRFTITRIVSFQSEDYCEQHKRSRELIFYISFQHCHSLFWPVYVHIQKRSARIVNVKVKYTLVQELRLYRGRTAHKGSRGLTLLFLEHGTRREWGVSVTSRSLFTPGKDPVPTVQEAEWAPGPVWIGAENFAPNGIRSPDHPACSLSLYRLRYLAHHRKCTILNYFIQSKHNINM